MLSESIFLLLGIFLTVGTGFFVASEFALLNLDRNELEKKRDQGEPGLSLTISALKVTSTHLSGAQLGITLTTLLAGYAMEPALSSMLRPLFERWDMSEVVIAPLSLLIAVTVATLISMVLGELVPKNFALALPEQTAKIVLPFQVFFTRLFRPIVFVLNRTANIVLGLLGIKPQEELSGSRSAEELASLVRRSARAGVLEEEAATLVQRTLVFSSHTAEDVMTARPQVRAVQRKQSVQDVIDLAATTGFSRFPVTGENIDDVCGVVHLKQAFSLPQDRRQKVPVSALSQEILSVPETISLDMLLASIRKQTYQMVAVVDEYGGFAGIVTLEDLIEELVGEVADEHDRKPQAILRGKDFIVFSGLLRPDEVLEHVGIVLPEGQHYETCAGFIMDRLGRMPQVKDEILITGGRLRVDRIDGRRIDRVRFIPYSEQKQRNEVEDE